MEPSLVRSIGLNDSSDAYVCLPCAKKSQIPYYSGRAFSDIFVNENGNQRVIVQVNENENEKDFENVN